MPSQAVRDNSKRALPISGDASSRCSVHGVDGDVAVALPTVKTHLHAPPRAAAAHLHAPPRAAAAHLHAPARAAGRAAGAGSGAIRGPAPGGARRVPRARSGFSGRSLRRGRDPAREGGPKGPETCPSCRAFSGPFLEAWLGPGPAGLLWNRHGPREALRVEIWGGWGGGICAVPPAALIMSNYRVIYQLYPELLFSSRLDATTAVLIKSY